MQVSTSRYTAYGLTIDSCIICPELLTGNGPVDVTVRYGKVPDFLNPEQGKDVWFESSQDKILLKIRNIARFLICGGNEILIQREKNASDNEIRLFLLGSALGAVLHQRGFLPLHGSAVIVNGGAVLFMGPRGIGKSTLAGAFKKRGYTVLADDVCVVSIRGNAEPMVFPGYPQLKLTGDTLDKIGADADSLPLLDGVTRKHGFSVRDRFCRKPAPVKHIYELGVERTGQFEMEHLKGAEKMAVVIANTYRLFFLDGNIRKAEHFKKCGLVAQITPVSRIRRPEKGFLLEELADVLEKDFEGRI